MKTSSLQQQYQICTDILLQAGTLLQKEVKRKQPRGYGNKAPVDLEIDQLICTQLRKHFPQDNIHSEEQGLSLGSSSRTFWIDPHDGTKDFLIGARETSISIALVENETLLMGFVYAPNSSPLLGPQGLLVSSMIGQQPQLHFPLYPQNNDPTILLSVRAPKQTQRKI
ncbi:MAG: inositol monophosphatase family protein, partial [Myxococcota bacterium]